MQYVRKLSQWISSLDDKSDYFRPMEWFFVIGGIHLESQNRWYRALFTLHRFQLVIQFLIWADRAYVALFEWKSLGDRIGVITFFIALIMIASRTGLMRFYLSELLDVRSYMSEQLNRLVRNKKRDRSYRLLRGIALAMEITFVVDQVVFYVFHVNRDPLYNNPDNLTRMGPKAELFFDVIKADANTVLSSLYATIVTVLNSVMMGFQVELDEIVICYADLFKRVDQKVHEKTCDIEGPANRKQVPKHLLWKYLKLELKSTIVRHNKFLEQLDKLSGFFKLSFLIMFYMEIVIHGSAIYYMQLQGFTMNTFITFCYAGSIFSECYWFCRLAEKLNAANAEIGAAIYGLEWPERLRYDPAMKQDYREVRTAMLVIMAKSQKDLGISSGGLFEMSIEAFGVLCKLIYNFLMFLLNTAQL